MNDDGFPTRAPRRRRNSWIRWIRRGIVLVVLGGGLIGAFLYMRRSDHSPIVESPRGDAMPAIEVEAARIEPQTVPLAPRFLGQTEASQVVEIRSRVTGYLLERAFEEGQRVEKGDVLFRIDSRPFEIELASATAALASAEARLEQASQQLERYQELFSRGSVAPRELEEWQTAKRVAEADVAQQTQRIRKAELELSYTTIEAPITGVIGRALKDAGTYVDNTTNSLLAILQQVDPIYVLYSVSEQEILRWHRLEREGLTRSPGLEMLELVVTLGDGTVYPLNGRINFVDVEVAPSTGTTIIRGTVPNPNDGLKPGQFVHVTVLGIDRVDATIVPQKAVLQTSTGSTVYVIDENGRAEPRPVELGDWIGDGWIVESGLTPGEWVITDRLMQIRPGAPVKVR